MSDLSPTVDSRGIDIDAAGRASRASGAASFASTARHARAWRRAAMVVISLGVLGAAGFGLRYPTPVGSFNFDIGFKLDQREDEDLFRIHFSITAF